MEDSFTSQLDVVAINKYMGWYHPWPVEPKDAIWEVVTDKPLIISEFGGEALYGQSGDENVVSSWSEESDALPRFLQPYREARSSQTVWL